MVGLKLNVLVYSGPGTTSESVRHCLLTLRRLLYPNYAVIPIGENALLNEPWPATCALLVIPGGADIPYGRVLNGRGNRRINQFVRAGGRYLGFCAGGYYGSQKCEFEIGNPPLEVIGTRELAFFPGICRGGAYKGFAYHTESGARAVRLTIHEDAFPAPHRGRGGGGRGRGRGKHASKAKTHPVEQLPTSAYSYYNGGGVFVDAASTEGVEILASYQADIDVDGGDKDSRAAVIYVKVGDGAALLTGPHPEFEPVNLVERPDLPSYQAMLEKLRLDDAPSTQARSRFLVACLRKLGLDVAHPGSVGGGSGGAASQYPRNNAIPQHITTHHLLALYTDEHAELISDLLEHIKGRRDIDYQTSTAIIQGGKDNFYLLRPDDGPWSWPANGRIEYQDTLTDSDCFSYFGTAMLIGLVDRGLRYPKLADLIKRVAAGVASTLDDSLFMGILRATAGHEEEGETVDQDADVDSADTDTNASTDTDHLAADVDALSIDDWRAKSLEERKEFDIMIDLVRQAVARVLLGYTGPIDLALDVTDANPRSAGSHGDTPPPLSPIIRQEIWNSLVHTNHSRHQRRIGTGREARLPAHVVDEIASSGNNASSADLADPPGVTTRLIAYEGGFPSMVDAFDAGLFYRSLLAYRSELEPAPSASAASSEPSLDWGNQIMYAKVTTSTNTLLETNPALLSALPSGFTFTAATQMAARGRGANVWLAPDGQLILSTVINHPHKFPVGPMHGDTGSRPVVFVQYIAAVAIVEAIHAYAPGFAALDVRLKWPNDIYVRDPESATDPKRPTHIKIGGILSQCSFSNGRYQVVLGIGLNTTNQRPTTSLDAVAELALSPATRKLHPIRMEKLLASLLPRLETAYRQFVKYGFAGGKKGTSLEARYYKYWLHSGQVVTLEAVAGAPQARVLGINTDWGLLRAEEVVAEEGSRYSAAYSESDKNVTKYRSTGRVWELQSDENSFDYWKGLVRTKE